MSDELHAYLDGVRAGAFTQTKRGALGFEYDEGYRRARGSTPMSLSLPLTREVHKNAPTRAFLQGLLPDSDGRLRELAAEYRVSEANPFALLSHIGRDAAGAVQLIPEGHESTDAATRTGEVVRHSDQDFADIVRDLIAHASTWGRRRAGRWSLPGAQPKIALFRTDDGTWATPLDSTPTTHIIKPAVPPYSEHHINEFMTMAAARHLGLDVATSELVKTAEDDNVFISTRYDRVLEGERWTRLHQEDLCQAMAIEPKNKYQSDGGPGLGKIADLFASLPNRQDREDNARRFFEALAFNVAAVGTDAHAKNYSVMLRGSRATLAPLYDLGTHAPYPILDGRSKTLAMSLDGEYVVDRVGENTLQVAGRRLGLDPEFAIMRAREITHGIVAAFAQAATDAARVLGGHGDSERAIGKIVDSIAAYAKARGWDRSSS